MKKVSKKAPKSMERMPPQRGEPIWTAIEDGEQIRKAVEVWRRKLASRSSRIGAMGRSDVFWMPSEQFWAHFSGTPAIPNRRRKGNYWNPFGLVPRAFRSHMIVEINPPISGKNTNVQGVIAVDPQGRRWVLHGGRMRLRDRPLTGEEFDTAYPGKRVVVSFSDGKTHRYHPVASIDEPRLAVLRQTAEFVRRCAHVRNFFEQGIVTAKKIIAVEAAERKLFPEGQGSYIVGARASVRAERVHSDVWAALKTAMPDTATDCANRVGRFGPDLYCRIGKTNLLFEIKSSASPSNVYEGFGQLHIYERLLNVRCRKILVLPELPKGEIFSILKNFDIRILQFSRSNNRVQIDRNALRGCF